MPTRGAAVLSNRNSDYMHAPGLSMDTSSHIQDGDFSGIGPFSQEFESQEYTDFDQSEAFHGSNVFPEIGSSQSYSSSFEDAASTFDPHSSGLAKQEVTRYGDVPSVPFEDVYAPEYSYTFGSIDSQPMCSSGSSEGYPALDTSYEHENWNHISEGPSSVPMSATSSGFGCSPLSPSPFVHLDQYTIPEESQWTTDSVQLHGNLPYRNFAEGQMPTSSYLAANSTVKPDVLGPGFLPSPEHGPADFECSGMPFSLPTPSRRLSDGETTSTARKDPLYQRGPSPSDQKYHCPFEDQGCNHMPEKLKCNYDKHLDSHLKPYQCNRGTCDSVRFSSTACLLRHEREAHALHGHGDRPFLCQFADCERAQPSKGFPRQWNLRDHMKRVHNYCAVQKTQHRAGLPSPPNSPDLAPSRKKKTSETNRLSGARKPKATSNKSRRDSHGSHDALKAHYIRSLEEMEPSVLQRCHQEGRIPVQDFPNLRMGVY